MNVRPDWKRQLAIWVPTCAAIALLSYLVTGSIMDKACAVRGPVANTHFFK